MGTIGFIGGGNMAEALIKGVIAAKLYKPENIFVSDIKQERLVYLSKYNVHLAANNAEAAAKADILVLAVKPQDMTQALQSVKAAVRGDTLIISIAAGKRVADIARILGDAAIVRVMPNTPALIGEGASALFANFKARPVLADAERIFSAVGKAVVVEDEGLIDVVTAVSGSGPAYYFLLMEEMIKAGAELGLPEDLAKDLVLQTAKGAALLAVDADKKHEAPAELRRKVTSPGGTTAAALKVFELRNFRRLVAEAIEQACKRSRELS